MEQELYKKAPKVVKLSPSDFENLILKPESVGNKRITFVMFYAGWCPHCQHAEPIWIKFSKVAPKDISVAVVDCVKYPELSNDFGINGYPTIKLFNSQGSFLGDYTGNQDPNSLIEFSKTLVSPPVSPRKSKSKPKGKSVKSVKSVKSTSVQKGSGKKVKSKRK